MLGNSGELKRPPKPYLIGQRFAIDRRTGQVVGPELAMWSHPGTKFRVMGRGDSKSYFVLVGIEQGAEDTAHFTFIKVTEFADGPAKPFTINSGSSVTSGICK